MLIDWFTVVAQIVNFLILVYLLKRFLYKPILRAIDERENRINTQLNEAATQKKEAEEQHRKYEHLHQELTGKKESMLSEAQKEAEKEHDNLMEKAHKEYEELRHRLHESLNKEQESLSNDLRYQAQREIFDVVRKVLADLADTSLEDQVVRVFIQKLNGLDQNEKDRIRAALKPSKGLVGIKTAFELTPDQQTAIKEAVDRTLNENIALTFQPAEEEVGGIELSSSGYKLAWTINDYLDSLEKHVSGLSADIRIDQPVTKSNGHGN